MTIKKKPTTQGDPKDHLANERTFLAWIRTSIGIMAFGFVIEKFGLYTQKFVVLFGQQSQKISLPLERSSSIFGMLLITFGAFISLLAFIDYKKVRKQIESDLYQPSNLLNLLIMLSSIVIGAFLIFSTIKFSF